MRIKKAPIRRFGSSYVFEFTKFEFEPFVTLRNLLDNNKKLPAYIETKDEKAIIYLPTIKDEKIVVNPVGEMTSVWKVASEYPRYYITIPKNIGDSINVESSVVEVDDDKIIIMPGITFRKSDFV